MASNANGTVSVAYPYSFAHRTGPDVRIVLDLDAAEELVGTEPILRLSDGSHRVRRPATVTVHGDRVRLEAVVPRRRLTPGTWQLALRPGPQQPLRRVRARLVVGRDRPVVLLPGNPPRAGIEPSPRPASVTPARRAFEAALRPLPTRRADQARALARRAVRRVRG